MKDSAFSCTRVAFYTTLLLGNIVPLIYFVVSFQSLVSHFGGTFTVGDMKVPQMENILTE